MLNDKIIEFLKQEQDKVCLRKLDNGFKMLGDALESLNVYIASSLPNLLNIREIDKLKKYADITRYIDSDIENIHTTRKELSSLLEIVVTKAENKYDEAFELYVLDINCKVCCDNELADKYTSVDVFDSNGTAVTTKSIWTRYCSVCKKHYIYKDMVASLATSIDDNHINVNGLTNKTIIQSEKIELVSVIVIEKTSTCPICQAELLSDKMNYYSFFDNELHRQKKQNSIFIKKCLTCDKIFITSGTHGVLERKHVSEYINLQIETISKANRTENSPVALENQCKHLGCNDIANHDGYCSYHYSEERYLSK